MSVQEAKDEILACGPTAHRLWPFPWNEDIDCASSLHELDVSNICLFFPKNHRWAEYCHDVLVTKIYRNLAIFRLSPADETGPLVQQPS